MSDDTQPSSPTVKLMKLRYAGTCGCGAEVPAGTRAGYDRAAKSVVCPDCLESREPAVQPTALLDVSNAPLVVDELIEPGVAGASLRREYERRVTAREKRIREKHRRLGGLILALSDEPATTRAFATGADGEERLAARLERDSAPDVLFLHNRKLGKGRRDGDIDHVAIAPSVIFLSDAKRYPISKIRIVRSGGLFSPVREQLMVGGRDRSKLLDGCAKQVAALGDALEGHPLAGSVQIKSLLCFIDGDLPLFEKLEMNGVRVLGPKGTVKTITIDGEFDAEVRASLHSHLAAALPPA